MHSRSGSRSAPGLVLGIAVIGLGILFILDNLRVINASDILRFWPVVLLVVGLVHLANGQWFGAGAWLLVGTLLLLDSLDIVYFNPFDLWPLLLVLIGVNIVRKALGGGRRYRGSAAAPELTSVAVLSGQSRKSSSAEFSSGDITAILGGSQVDLREADMEEGEKVIEVLAIWGGIDIRVPTEWTVVPSVTTFMGSFEDKTDHGRANPAKRLVVRGLALMGGVDIKN